MCQLYFRKCVQACTRFVLVMLTQLTAAAAADSNSICGVTLQEPFWDCPKPGPGLIWAMDLNVLVSAVAAGAICNMRNPSRAAGNDPDLA